MKARKEKEKGRKILFILVKMVCVCVCETKISSKLTAANLMEFRLLEQPHSVDERWITSPAISPYGV